MIVLPNLPRVALVTNVLSHYRVPCFEALAARMPGQIDFFLLSGEMPHRAYVLANGAASISTRVLPGWSRSHPPFDDLHLNDPRPALRGYDLVILGGWAEPSYLLLWVLAQLKRTRVAFWIESTLCDLSRQTWRESVKRLMLSRASGAIVPGQSAAAYCEWLGLSRERIFVAPNAVDTSYFRKQAETLLPIREDIRRELGLDGVVILFVGRMVESLKGISLLLEAQRRIESQDSSARLALVGEGENRPGYERMVQELRLRSVKFIDFQRHDSLSRYYASADVFVLPSRSEPWGFVLNEAMEFGLPLVVTQAVGASPDLVTEGENGFVVPTGDAEALANALKRLVTDSALRRQMGEVSKRRIVAFSPEHWADGFVRAIGAMTHAD